MNTLLVGMAPGRNSNPRAPLFPAPRNSSGHRLVELIGLTRGEYMKMYDRVNCLPAYPGADPKQKGDRFPMASAKLAAAVHRQHFRGRRVIFIGRQVAHAFGFPKSRLDFFHWSGCHEWGYRCAVVPHTSGCNRFWNDPENRARAREFFQDEISSRMGFTSG